MTALFKAPKMPSPEALSPETVAAQKRQEARLAEEERRQAAQMASRTRARRFGGQRMLLSPTREDARLGISSDLGV